MWLRVQPIGHVRTARQTPEDDNWGGVEAIIELSDDRPETALAGLDAFSHAEIIFVFDQVDLQTIVTGVRHPRNNQKWPWESSRSARRTGQTDWD